MRIEHPYTGKTNAQAYEAIDNLLEELQKQYVDNIKNPSKAWNPTKDEMSFRTSQLKETLCMLQRAD